MALRGSDERCECRTDLSRLLLSLVLTCGVALACGPSSLPKPGAVAGVGEWPAYGGDPGGARHAALTAVTRENVASLRPAWTYRHGDVSDGQGEIRSTTAFENTPILVDGLLYLCTPFNRVIALDPASGAERWVFDPEIDLTGRYANQLICRGVSTWLDPAARADAACRRTVFTGTNDARLIAQDARTGTPCPDFGSEGVIDLNPGPGPQHWKGEYQVTSPPAVVGDVVVMGSAVSDNARIDAPSGVVRGFDARTGALRWAWDLAPPEFDYERGPTSEAGYALGTPNVWAPMSVDEGRDLVFVPTGNAAPDYYRGERHRMNHYGSSVVALRGETGEIAWHFQTVHNDLWDFDVPAQPTLTRIDVNGEPRDALVQATKMGLLFVLDRETGEPLLPVDERPVPTAGAPPSEVLSPTQPFPRIPILIRDSISPEDAWGVTPWDRGLCREKIEALRFDGMYTPPSLQGTIMLPGNAGGSNWGGIAVDPERQLALVRSSDVPWAVTLIPRADFEAERAARPGVEHGPQIGTPYGLRRELLISPLGFPCIGPPWGTLAAVDLRSGEIRWQVPHGSVRDLSPVPLPLTWGVPGTGGPVVTSGGLVFIAAAMDDYLRAFDVETGEELWKGRLPAGGQATPMTYRVTFEDGGARQYVLIAAGGHARAGTTLGDHLVAFALEE
jgi:quinoprotein glucose dehydrogenase